MKRILLLTALLLACGLFCSCTVEVRFASPQQTAVSETQGTETAEPAQTTAFEAAEKQSEIRAAWVSYTELNPKRLQAEAAFRAVRSVRHILPALRQ